MFDDQLVVEPTHLTKVFVKLGILKKGCTCKKNTVLETTTLNEVVFVDVTNCKLHEADFSLSPQIVQLGGHPLPAMAIQQEKTARAGLPFILSCH